MANDAALATAEAQRDDYRALSHELQSTNRLVMEAHDAAVSAHESIVRERDELVLQVGKLRALLKEVFEVASNGLAKVAV